MSSVQIMSTVQDRAIYNVKLSFCSAIFSISSVPWIYQDYCYSLSCIILRSFIIMCTILGLAKMMFQPRNFEVIWRATVIGTSFSVGLSLFFRFDHLWLFSTYLCFLSFFHFSEYIATGLTNPANLQNESFLLNHSLQYWLAAIFSWMEHFLELYFFPSIKISSVLFIIGIVLCVTGEAIRKTAMFHAGKSFSHIVQNTKKSDHELVTTGIFSMMRHPSYVGWFIWSIATQILLANPLCFLAYGYVSWTFFNERIYVEEFSLLQFFGEAYAQYQRRVPVGIPFIKGYVPDQ